MRLSIGEVALRPVTDADLPAIDAMFPDDDEQDPRWEHFAGLSAQRNRHRLLVQRTWHHRGSWSPSSWCLDLAVEVSGELVGLQALRADDFAKLRTVDSGSWLAVHARGRGAAVAMRTAILGLAFDHLGAVAAISCARVDNERLGPVVAVDLIVDALGDVGVDPGDGGNRLVVRVMPRLCHSRSATSATMPLVRSPRYRSRSSPLNVDPPAR